MQANRIQIDRFAWIVLAVGLVVRIAVILIAYHTASPEASDGAYYILIAREPARLLLTTDAPVYSVGPIYPMFLIPFYHLISSSAPIAQAVAVRITQAVLDSFTCLAVYLIAKHLFGERTGRIALLAQAFDARYLFVAGTIATETLFIALFAGFMVAYLVFAVPSGRLLSYWWTGVILGIAVLARPIPIAFPAVLAVYAFFAQSNRKRALQGTGILLAAMLFVISPWWLRNVGGENGLVPVSDTIFSHFWLASRPDARDLGGDSWDEAALEDATEVMGERPEALMLVNPQTYATAGLRNILAAPGPWIGRIASDLLKAYAQPYGTALLIDSHESAKSVLANFLSGEESLTAMLILPGLLRRILMYLWHYWGLIGGIIGAALSVRHREWQGLPLIGWIAYCSAGLSLLLVEPRYLFPLMFAFTIFAAHATVRGWEAVRARVFRAEPSLQIRGEQQA